MNKLKFLFPFFVSFLITACASFNPQIGMTFEDLQSKTALSFNGSLIEVASAGAEGLRVYITGDQNYNDKHVKDYSKINNRYFYFKADSRTKCNTA
jgi:hypothetical protein